MAFPSHGVPTGFEYDVCKMKLGSGGSGMVFLAQHRHTGDLVAVKRLFAKGAAAPAAEEEEEEASARTSARQPSHLHHSARRMATLTPEGNNAADAKDNTKRRYRRRSSSSSSSSSTSSGSGGGSSENSSINRGEREEEVEEEEVEVVDDDDEDNNRKDEQSLGGVMAKAPCLCARTPVAPPAAHPPCEGTIMQYLGPHPHIVKFLGSYTNSRRTTFFAMELMDSDLGRELRAANTAFMNEDVARPLLHSVISAIAHLHKRGVAHRDIKPSNILLKCLDTVKPLGDIGEQFSVAPEVGAECSGGADCRKCDGNGNKAVDHDSYTSCLSGVERRVKAVLGDFSAAHFIRESASVGSGRGTLYYKAPEQLMGRVENYFACDMWALGCTLFELSTGSIAFCGSNDLQVLHQICAKLGTEFQRYPKKVHEATLFDSLSAPSAVFLDILEGLLALDPRERLTASDALKHAFFNPIRQAHGVYNPNAEMTFSLHPRRCSRVDASQFVFRPISNTSSKRLRVAVAGSMLQTKTGANHSDMSLSCSGQRCSMWSSSVSGASSPNAYWSRARSQQEGIDGRCCGAHPSGLFGNCSAIRPLSLSSLTTTRGVGVTSVRGNDENHRGIDHVVSPVPLRFSPLTSVKRHGGGGGGGGGGGAPPEHHGTLLRFTPSSNGTLGNMQRSIQFEGALLSARGTAGPRTLLEDDAHASRYDVDSPSVRKMLFGSPQRSLLGCLSDSLERGEGVKTTADHNNTGHLDGPLRYLQRMIKSPRMLLPAATTTTTTETSLHPMELSRTVPSNGNTHVLHDCSGVRVPSNDENEEAKGADKGFGEKANGIQPIDINVIMSPKPVYRNTSSLFLTCGSESAAASE